MDEKEKNRAHFLLDCLENNGQITLNREDMLNILKLNREITIEEFVSELKKHKEFIFNGCVSIYGINEIAEQMKGGAEWMNYLLQIQSTLWLKKWQK